MNEFVIEKRWYGFGTVENGDPQTSFLSGFAGIFLNSSPVSRSREMP